MNALAWYERWFCARWIQMIDMTNCLLIYSRSPSHFIWLYSICADFFHFIHRNTCSQGMTCKSYSQLHINSILYHLIENQNILFGDQQNAALAWCYDTAIEMNLHANKIILISFIWMVRYGFYQLHLAHKSPINFPKEQMVNLFIK